MWATRSRSRISISRPRYDDARLERRQLFHTKYQEKDGRAGFESQVNVSRQRLDQDRQLYGV